MLAASAAETNTDRAAIVIDYPQDGSIFPPEITPPAFLWHDAAKGAISWRIDISFGPGVPPIHAVSKGGHLRIGPIDPDAVAPTNEPPKLSPQLADAHAWTPDAATWAAIKRQSVDRAATITISGIAADREVSTGKVWIRTSRDPVAAPIFYRDVPLMPSQVERGVIKPLATEALPLVKWRVRNVGETSGRVVMDDLPVCGNCHSFSADGKTLGMDLDSLENYRGIYMLAKVAPEISVTRQDLTTWSSPEGKIRSRARAGFMSQVSPDGQYVVSTVNPESMASTGPLPPSNYYVENFRDYRFLQVFYPTRGIVTWYSRQTGVMQPLPGADDPRYVQMGAMWSPDGQYLVFQRAGAKDANPPGMPAPKFAGDPEELPLKYDLYRIPFRGGQGGVAEPITGASRNGMSNTFPKVSPDGRWIVFVKTKNGELMRPDSQLYIVPAAGGEARKMRCNTPTMNSWHSFSPNGRWMVFSSKARSPYTQLYLTHIDAGGNDSPPILIDNTTASNRAANIPEFVNIPPDGLQRIGGPVMDYYRLVNTAAYLQRTKQYAASIARWREVLAGDPDDEFANRNLGTVLMMTGHREEAGAHLQKAAEIHARAAVDDDPKSARPHADLGALLEETGRPADAAAEFRKALEIEPGDAAFRVSLGEALTSAGRPDDAIVELRRALGAGGANAPARYALGRAFDRKGESQAAVEEYRRALQIDPQNADVHIALGDLFLSQKRPADALTEWRAAIEFRPTDVALLEKTAWLLATSPEAPIRNGEQAMAFATKAMQYAARKDARLLDILAAAYAEKGDFDEAQYIESEAVDAAGIENRPALVKEMLARHSLYLSHQAFRD
ncbi:MAG TPA: tetratricopeptide repeat protein [Bryobacteraceae bacterium]|nr:tetratricopeptide repeat protein [Bryobacteraceae bacterium]